MSDDYKNKDGDINEIYIEKPCAKNREKETENKEEMDAFFSKFELAEEVENQFDKITSNLDRELREDDADEARAQNPEGAGLSGEGGGMNAGSREAARGSGQDPNHPHSSRLSRLEQKRERKKRRSLHPLFSPKGSDAPQDESQDLGERESFSFKEALLTLWAAICAIFSALLVKLKLVNPPEGEGASGETGVSMAGKRKRKKHYKINGKQLFKFILSLGVALCLIVGVMVGVIIATTPPIKPDNIYELLSENSTMYDDEGNVVDSIHALGSSLRTNVAYKDLPPNLVNAFIAIEDKTFWTHHGFNVVRIFGAIYESITKGEAIGGTSTITQQLARNLYLTADMSKRTMTRKIREAWYTVQLEKNLTKEEIMEAYLNTIYLGANASGVQAASQAYFSKDVGELTLPECALLATLPKNPRDYSPIKGDSNEKLVDTDLDKLDIISRTDDWTTWYNNKAEDRQKLVLKFMLDQELISQQEYDEAAPYNIRDSIKPGENVANNQISSYFADYTLKQVLKDLVSEGVAKDEENAKDLLYNRGLRIYSTMSLKMQKAAEEIFEDSSNFPGVRSLNKDKSGNVRDKNNRIMLYNKETYFDSNENFILSPDEFARNQDGSLTLLKGKRLNFYNVSFQGKSDINIEFKPLYEMEDKAFYSRTGGVIQVPAKYKSQDKDGNMVISANFFEEVPDFFQSNGDSLSVSSGHYMLHARIRQPQAAMVIMDQATGGIKAMVGGRNVEGRMIFNRATGTRQPGSSIKPMGVYGPALQSGANKETGWTAGSIIDDAPMTYKGKLWPKNWYSGYRGLYTLRQSVEQSVNVNAVKVFNDIGAERSLQMLKSFGVTSVVESGEVNDLNSAALALGGMTKGISPLEMCAGYAVFANDGIYMEPVSYTKVTNKRGEIVLERTPESHRVLDEGPAAIMRDILRTTVTRGLAKAANIGSSHPTAGKTGTTTDQYDAWFVGFSPKYTASVWVGNDVNIELTKGSAAATSVWSKVMKKVHAGLPAASFKPMPSDVVSVSIDSKSGKLPTELSRMDPRNTVINEFFVKGTQPTEPDDVHVEVTVCSQSGYLATPWCPSPITKVAIKRPDGPVENVADGEYDAPATYCNLHNLDPGAYPVKEGLTADPNFTWTPPADPNNPDNPWGGQPGEGTEPNNGNGSGSGGEGGQSGGANGTGNGGSENTPTPPGGTGNGDNGKPDWLGP